VRGPNHGGTPTATDRKVSGSVVMPDIGATQIRVLSGLFALAGGFSILFGVVPNPALPIDLMAVQVGVVLLVCSVVILVLARYMRPWTLDVVIAIAYLLAAYGVSAVRNGENQLLIGLALMAFATFAAYFLPHRRFLWHLVAMLTAFVIAAIAAPLASSWLAYVAVVVAVAGVSVVVSMLVSAMRELVMRDDLTGLLNRRGLDVLTASMHAVAERSGAPITVGMIDLDGFKAFNDAHGHAAGDSLLVELVRAWEPQLRETDVLARYGGDEFALVLPGSDVDEALEISTRLHSAHDAQWSVGFATWQTGEDLYQALIRADQDLYDIKRSRPSIPQQPAPKPDTPRVTSQTGDDV